MNRWAIFIRPLRGLFAAENREGQALRSCDSGKLESEIVSSTGVADEVRESQNRKPDQVFICE
jgi:hypothetical protein